MKKLTAILIMACLCLSLCAMLTSCGHEHEYEAAWTFDGEHHWHACKGEGCKEVAGKAAHAWNGGEITAEPTKESAGVKTFTCTDCGETKAEPVPYVSHATVTEEEWRAALAKEKFYNVTVTYYEYSYDEESGEADGYGPTVYEYDGKFMRNDNSAIRENSGDMDTEELAGIIGRGKDRYAYAAYDEEAERYTVDTFDEYYEMNFALVYQYEDGALVRFELHFLDETGTREDMYKTQWMVLEFSKYGETSLTVGEKA